MAEKKPFIAARLRNPAEEANEKNKKKQKKPRTPAAPGKTDWVGFGGALVAFALSVALLVVLYGDMDVYATYLGQTVTDALMK